ncbi:MAG: TonB-dependent receptor, partial [Acidobacteria bacterium]|nr:TonB-dependent receptor [Acidobacteriota bacterium]
MTDAKINRRLGVLPVGLLIVALAAPLFAQVTTATIYGRVEDQSGGVIPGAVIDAINTATGVSKTASSNERGEFAIPYVPVGPYTVTVAADGFNVHEQTGLNLTSGQKVDLTYVLKIGATTERVTVTAEAPLLNTISAEQDINLSADQVDELPMRNRDITSIIALGTGAASDGLTISLNGLPPRGFTFAVDGVNAVPDSEFASLAAYQNYNFVKGVSVEAVQGVEVSKNIFSAEIANTLAGNVNIITKGGTNQLHGSAFEQYQAGGLNANNHLLARKTSLVFHQYGGSLGGPIIKNKLFVFGTFEGYRRNAQQALTGFVPSNSIVEQTIAAIPESRGYWDLWPRATSAPENPGDVVAFFTGADARMNKDNTASVRTDYSISDNDLLTVRYTRGRPFQRSPRLAMGNSRRHVGLTENLSATYNRVWSPTVTSETRFGYNRADLDRVDEMLLAGIAQISGAGLPSPSQGRLFAKKGSTSTLEQNFAFNRGKHAMKVGGLYQLVFVRRAIDDTPDFSFATVADLLANRPISARFNFGLDPFEMTRWQTGFFFQDDIRVSKNLTLNLGVRWDYDSVPRERDDRFSNRITPFGETLPADRAWNAQYNSFSPRAGFAYKVGDSGKTVIRGGAGMFTMPHNFFSGPVEIIRNGPDSPAEVGFAGSQITDAGVTYPFDTQMAKAFAQSSSITGGTVVDPNWRNAYSLQFNLGVQRQLTDTMVLDVAYVGNHGVKVTTSPTVNRLDRVTGTLPRPDFTSRFRFYQSNDSTLYHSLQTSLKKRFSRNLSFNMNYTYASNMAYSSGDLSCCLNEPWDLNNLANNRAPTGFHVRHSFLFDFLYEIPTPGNFQGAAKHILGGWQLGGILTV